MSQSVNPSKSINFEGFNHPNENSAEPSSGDLLFAPNRTLTTEELAEISEQVRQQELYELQTRLSAAETQLQLTNQENVQLRQSVALASGVSRISNSTTPLAGATLIHNTISNSEITLLTNLEAATVIQFEGQITAANADPQRRTNLIDQSVLTTLPYRLETVMLTEDGLLDPFNHHLWSNDVFFRLVRRISAATSGYSLEGQLNSLRPPVDTEFTINHVDRYCSQILAIIKPFAESVTGDHQLISRLIHIILTNIEKAGQNFTFYSTLAFRLRTDRNQQSSIEAFIQAIYRLSKAAFDARTDYLQWFGNIPPLTNALREDAKPPTHSEKRQRTTAVEPPAMAVKHQSTSPLIQCEGCGSTKHVRSGCKLQQHPHFNPNHGVAWHKSTYAGKYSALPYDPTRNQHPWKHLPDRLMWAPSPRHPAGTLIPWDPVAQRSNPSQGKILDYHTFDSILTAREPNSVLNAITSNSSPITISGSVLANSIFIPTNSILIDTGATQYNYVGLDFSQQLKKHGLVSTQTNIKTSLPINNHPPMISYFSFNITLKFLNELLNSLELITFTVIQLDIPFDIIVGRPTILEHKLLLKLCKHFDIDKQVNPSVITPTLLLLSDKSELLDYESDGDDIPFPDSQFYDHELYAITQQNDSTIASDLLNHIRIDGSPSLQQSLRQLCTDYSDIFAESLSSEPARVEEFFCEVDDLKWSDKSNRLPPRPLSRAKQAEVQRQVTHMLQLGVIEPSTAGSYSQVVLVPKPDNKYRFCIDYRQLNAVTKPFGWPIPNIRLTLDRIGSKKPKIFGSMDAVSGYHQIPIRADSRKYTAFITPTGLYQFKRVSMGMKSAGSFFMQVMCTLFSTVLYIFVEIYFDDILTHGQDDADFLSNLTTVFNLLRTANIKLNPKKCKFGLSQIEFVGHLIDATGITFTKERLFRAMDIARPETIRDIQAFLGTINYFRNHIKNHSIIASPIHKLVIHSHPHTQTRPRQSVIWTADALTAFENLKQQLRYLPKLYYLDTSAEIFLHTDACNIGLGAYLYQLINNIEQPIAFLSKAFTGAQLRWSTIEQECYAIVYAFITLDYLLRDVHFTLRTDHKNLTYINLASSKKVTSWKLICQDLDYSVEHVPGKINVIADAFSRLVTTPPQLSGADITVAPTMALLCFLPPPRDPGFATRDFQGTSDSQTGQPDSVPRDIKKLLGRFHNSAVGHRGVDATLNKLKEAGHIWPLMRQHIQSHIKYCPCCQKMAQLRTPICANRFVVSTLSPMTRLAIDTVVSLPTDPEGYNSIICIIDTFTRFVELYPTKDTTAKSAADALLKHSGRYGFANELLSDNGTQYVNNIITELTQLLHTEHVLILAYSHEENGIVERAIREILRHLRQIVFHTNIIEQWVVALPLVQRIMNASVHSSIGCTPSQLLFGNAINLDRVLLSDPSDSPSKPHTLSEWSDNMLSLQTAIIKRAQEVQLDSHIRHRSGQEPVSDFPVNSYVLVEYPSSNYHPGPPTKLHAPLRGPMKVQSVLGNTYELLNLATNSIEKHHIKQLQPFNYDKHDTIPEDIALKDNQFFIVEQILNHQGDFKHKTSLFFLVKWKHFDSVFNSWEPWKSLKDNLVLHHYLMSNNLGKHIPPKYRPH